MNKTQTLIENLVYNRDTYGVYLQLGEKPDGGDGLNRIGAAYACMGALGAELDDVNLPLAEGLKNILRHNSVDLPDGRYRRHPDPKRWYYNENNVTRDQMVTVESAWATCATPDLARTHMKLRLKRCLFHFSSENDGMDAGPLIKKFPDPPSLSELGTIIRACRLWYLYPLLPVLDVQLLIDIAWGRSLNERNLWDSDNQLLPQMAAALKVYPTPTSLWARHIYAKTDARDRLINLHVKSDFPALGELMAYTFDKLVRKLDL